MSTTEAVVLYSYKPKSSQKEEISVDEKEIVQVIQTLGNGFTKIQNKKGQVGLVPTQCLRKQQTKPIIPQIPIQKAISNDTIPPSTQPGDKTQIGKTNTTTGKPLIPIDFKSIHHNRTLSSPMSSPRLYSEQGVFKSPRASAELKSGIHLSPRSPKVKGYFITSPIMIENYIKEDSQITDEELDIKINTLMDELSIDIKAKPGIQNLSRDQKLKMLESHEKSKRPKSPKLNLKDESPRQKTPRSVSISNPRLIEKRQESPPLEDEEMDTLFERVLEENGIDPQNKPQFKNLPREQKQIMIDMYQTKKKHEREENEKGVKNVIADLSRSKISPDVMKSVVIMLEYADHEWIVDFVQWGGVGLIASHLAQTNLLASSRRDFTDYVGKIFGISKNRDDPMQLYCIEAFYYLINDTVGINAFIEEKDAIRSFVLVFDAAGMKTKANIAFLLAVVSKYSMEGSSLVAEAFSYYKLVKREPYRFFDLVNSLSEIREADYQVNCLMLINALLYTEDKTLRELVKKEMINLEVLKKIKLDSREIQDIDIRQKFINQLKFLEDAIYEGTTFGNLNDPIEIVKSLHVQLPKPAQDKFLNIIKQLLSFSASDDSITLENWSIAEKLIDKMLAGKDSSNRVKNLDDEYNNLMNLFQTQQKTIQTLEKNIKEEKAMLKIWFEKVKLGETPPEIKGLELFKDLFEEPKVETVDVPIPPVPVQVSGNAPPSPPTMGGPPRPPGPPGVPGPPGPPGAPKMNEPSLFSLPQYKPKIPMKKLHFEAINKKKITSTIFVKIAQDSIKVKLNQDELESLFGSETVKKEKLPKKEVVQTKSLLDPKRSYNVSIKLSRLPLRAEELKREILDMNEEILNPTVITMLQDIVPTDTEIDLFANVEDTSLLAEADKFMISIKDIPSLHGKIEAWAFKNRYTMENAQLRAEIESIILAAEEMKSNVQFQKVLSIVLAIGNFLNSQGNKKDSYGFKLNTLLKLKDLRSNNESNLLEYIVQFVDRDVPELAKFYETLKMISIAKRISLQYVKENIGFVRNGLSHLEKQLKMSEKHLNRSDKFVIVMHPFHKQVTEEFKKIMERNEVLEKLLVEICTLYDEDKTQITQKPEEFFEMVDQFCISWRDALERFKDAEKKKNDRIKKLESKKEKGLLEKLGEEMSTKKGLMKK